LTFSLPMLVWQVLFFLAPLVFLIALSFWTVRNFRMEPDFNPDNWFRMLGRAVFWEAYFRTLILSASAAVITSVLAFPCAYGIAFKLSETARRWAVFLMVIPFFTSYLVRVYSWQIFLSDNGIINVLLAKVGLGPFGMLNSAFGVMVGYLTLSFPLVVLLQLFSLVFVDKTLIEAAHNLRCGRLRTMFEVVVPAAKVGLVIAALFCFILTFGDFVSPLYLGGGDPPTLSILITDTTKSGQQWPRAAVIALTMIATLLAVAFAAVSFAYRERGR
jgi:spermidine/putrescine transport system permease protein/putrescine transport system permease protein